MSTIVDQLIRFADERPDAPAITCAEQTLTWHQLRDGAARMGAHFAAAGAEHGSLVTIGMRNSTAFVEAIFGAWWIGATPSPIAHSLPAHERRAIIELAQPAVAIGVDPEDAAGHPVLSLEQARRAVKPVEPADEPSPRWRVIPSGGSTGRPKLVVAEQPADVDAMLGLAGLLRFPSDSAIVAPGPLSHSAPFVATALGLALGNHVINQPRFDAGACLGLVEEHGAQWLYQVPTMMLRIWRLPEAERLARDLSSLQTVFHMAAPCPPWLKREWIDWLGGEKILELYAGTETQAMTIINGDQWVAHPGSVGQVMLGEMEVRDTEGTPLPAGEIGEIWMRRGPDEAAPYRYIGATPRTADEHWESLGDNGHFDDDGFLYLADRATDMIVVGGSNVYPAEIEAALDEHPAVRSSCVIGLPHEDLGNAPHALVELSEDVDDDTLIAWVGERVASYKVPKTFERVDEPLRDDAGKVRRSQLRAARV